MPRVARYEIFYDGCYARVISRSVRKVKLFKNEEDFNYFKKLLRRAKKAGKFKIFHYRVTQTRFHLAVQTGDIKEFSNSIRDLKRNYIVYYHSKYRISGPLWRERYKGLLIENELYLYACGKYIESNPLRAGLVSKAEDWKYSSVRRTEVGKLDDLVDRYECHSSSAEKIKIEDEEFEEGNVIGSGFFRYQFLQNRKRN